MTDNSIVTLVIAVLGLFTTIISSAIGAYATIKAAELSSRSNASQLSSSIPSQTLEKRKLIRRTITILSVIIIGLGFCFCLIMIWGYYYGDTLF